MRLSLLAVVALAATAGCAGFAGPSDRGTVTPAPIPEPTVTGTERGIAPGVGGAEITDPRRLAAAHRQAIRGRSYTWSERGNATVFEEGEPVRNTTVRRHLRVEGEDTYRFEQSASWRPGNVSEFAVDGTRYRRALTEEGYEFSTDPATSASERFGDRPETVIERFLAIDDATVAETRVDGEQYYRISGTTDDIPVAGEISNFSVRALVSPAGFVRELFTSYDSVIDGDRHHIEYRFRYAAVGSTTVESPAWVREHFGGNTTVTAAP